MRKHWRHLVDAVDEFLEASDPELPCRTDGCENFCGVSRICVKVKELEKELAAVKCAMQKEPK